MGAPKQKWTSEEENALKAGVVKHGAGNWRTILRDPEFSAVLCLRSNVDLKDKWRNMSVTANGWGSREKARLALKRSRHVLRQDDNPMAFSTTVEGVDDIIDIKPLAMSDGDDTVRMGGSNRKVSRLDHLIVEAITNLKEPSGSNKTAIATYIEDQYWAPPNFKRVMSAKLKNLVGKGKLIKVKRKYRIAPVSPFFDERSPRSFVREGKQKDHHSYRFEKDDFKPLTKSQIDAELVKMRNMTASEAAAVAAQAVAEAEAAMEEAEAAAREAELAEAEAEEAQAFAEAAAMSLQGRNLSRMMVNG